MVKKHKPTLGDIQSALLRNPSLAKLNPHLGRSPNPAVALGSQPNIIEKPKTLGKRRKSMNQTEADFARILDARVKRGEIISYEYEGLTLRWGKLDNIQYTPDFVVFENVKVETECSIPFVRICFIEVKGPKIWPKDIAKFKQARNEWPLFGFELWQRLSRHRQWDQIL